MKNRQYDQMLSEKEALKSNKHFFIQQLDLYKDTCVKVSDSYNKLAKDALFTEKRKDAEIYKCQIEIRAL